MECISVSDYVFTNNDKTVHVIDSIGAFPDELKESLNVSNR